MADLGMDLDHTQVEAGQGFNLMPPHECMAQIIESDVSLTKVGTGKIAKLTIELMDGPYANRKVWDNVNFVNPNPTAQLIGQQRMKAYCEAVGHAGPLRNTDDLHYRPFTVKVGVSKPQDGYEQRNEIKNVKALASGQPPTRSAPVNTSTARSTQNGGATSTFQANQPPPQRAAAGAGGAAWRK